jgi:hypothetical protein
MSGKAILVAGTGGGGVQCVHPLPEESWKMIRKGSIDGLAEEIGDAELLRLALEDYDLGKRRERASRVDFVLGWVAAYRRLREGKEDRTFRSSGLTVAA